MLGFWSAFSIWSSGSTFCEQSARSTTEWKYTNGSATSGCLHGSSIPSTYARHSKPQVDNWSASVFVSAG